jgi:hypothetical protein
MKCSNPDCNRGIGLVAYRCGWFSKRHYCSRNCRDALVTDAPKLQQKRSATTYFEWLFGQPILTAQPKMVPAAIRALRYEEAGGIIEDLDFDWGATRRPHAASVHDRPEGSPAAPTN